MNTTCVPIKTFCKARGFTLPEVMIASTIFGLVMAGVLSSLLFFGRSHMRANNAAEMTNQSRLFQYQFSRDIRNTTDVLYVAPDACRLRVVNQDGLVEVFYEFDPRDNTVYRIVDDNVRPVLRHVEKASFLFYNLSGKETFSPSAVRSIQFESKNNRKVAGVQTEGEVLSARYFIRTKYAGGS